MEVGITGKMLEAIHDYIVCRGDITESDYLFVSHARGYKEAKLNPVMVSRIVKRRLREIGLDSKFLTCHSLRHTAAILSLKAGATIYIQHKKRQKLNYKPNPIKTKERKVDFPLKYNLLTRK